ncbi:hypothetical protein MTO96_020658 [Rhipicephalus appendiculatus]
MESEDAGASKKASRRRGRSCSPGPLEYKPLNPDGTFYRRWLDQQKARLGDGRDAGSPPGESDDLEAPSTSQGRGSLWTEPPAPPEPPKRPVGVASPFISARLLLDRFSPAVRGLAVGSSPALRPSEDDRQPSSSAQVPTLPWQVQDHPR